MKISDEVIGVLSTVDVGPGPAPAGSNVAITTGQLDRKLYVKTNEVLEAIGGKWSRKAKAHLFDSSASVTRERIDEAIIACDVVTPKDLGFFPTPADLARDLVRSISIPDGSRVLEPSAGTGRIVDAVLTLTDATVVAVEIDERKAAGLRDCTIGRERVLVGDFLAMSVDDLGGDFDAVVMNPPFGRIGAGDHLDHVHHAFKMLRPGGALVAILPSGVKFRVDRRHREFREFFLGLGGTMRDLADDAFRESGTGVRTVTLRATR